MLCNIYICIPNTNYERNGTFSRLKHQATKTCMENPKKNVAHSQLELHITELGTLTIKYQQCGPPHSHLGHCTGQMHQNLTLTFYEINFSYFIQSTIQYTSCGTEALPYWNRIEHSQGTPCDVLRMIFCALCDAAATSVWGDPWKPRFNRDT